MAMCIEIVTIENHRLSTVSLLDVRGEGRCNSKHHWAVDPGTSLPQDINFLIPGFLLCLGDSHSFSPDNHINVAISIFASTGVVEEMHRVLALVETISTRATNVDVLLSIKGIRGVLVNDEWKGDLIHIVSAFRRKSPPRVVHPIRIIVGLSRQQLETNVSMELLNLQMKEERAVLEEAQCVMYCSGFHFSTYIFTLLLHV